MQLPSPHRPINTGRRIFHNQERMFLGRERSLELSRIRQSIRDYEWYLEDITYLGLSDWCRTPKQSVWEESGKIIK